MIPLKSYSQKNIQDTLIINNYQARAILRDKAKLRFLEKNSKLDSLLILEYKIKDDNHIKSENTYKLLVDSKDKTINRLRFQNKLIIIGASVVTGYLLYQTLK